MIDYKQLEKSQIVLDNADPFLVEKIESLSDDKLKSYLEELNNNLLSVTANSSGIQNRNVIKTINDSIKACHALLYIRSIRTKKDDKGVILG